MAISKPQQNNLGSVLRWLEMVNLLMLNTINTTLTTSSPPGERVDGDDVEMVDSLEEDEEVEEEEDAQEEEEVEEEEVSEDGASEDEDEVTETNDARSEEGKEPVFHHEIYDRLVTLTSSQGAYSKFFFLSFFFLFLKDRLTIW